TTIIKSQEGRAPSTRQPARGPIHHPPFPDKLLGDQRNCTALQSRYAGKVRPRNGLAPPDQIQYHSAVDVSRSFARSYLRVGKVNSTHLIRLSNYISDHAILRPN